MEKTAQELVSELTASGLTPQEIAEKIDHRVSARTIYRWGKGESEPGNTSDLEALRTLASSVSKT